ncbi:hypothetical protein EXIGLDRAFT_274499 [Exidia glandulosa HHB12029]|uniref:Fe2OG dioxygenase domain-containing protein n=1 Tax=Exidia glandulosa HHB12029 TaxID=1314781 RepID=A0A165M7A1_EXIGL|nr:hypothetical protein EXIGLDRAFT_274499 [Exidia glandulosa HHB12029]
MQYFDEKERSLLEEGNAGAHPPLNDPLGGDTLDRRAALRFNPEGEDPPVRTWYNGQQAWYIPQERHPLAKVLSQVALPKWWNFSPHGPPPKIPYWRHDWRRDYEDDHTWGYKPPVKVETLGLEEVQLASTADGVPLGTIGSVDLQALRALLEPSHFGRGADTIYDESVRKGLEVKASKMNVVRWNGSREPSPPSSDDEDLCRYNLCSHNPYYPGSYNLYYPGSRNPYYQGSHNPYYPGNLHRRHHDPPARPKPQTVPPNPFTGLAKNVQKRLFPGRPVTLRFYKLALYESGGHFEFHRDSTHADSHHGTLLVACGVKDSQTYYDGGHLILSADGAEDVFELGPGDAVAFYTDVQHAVSPVTRGTRITLQFDIFLEDCTEPEDEDGDTVEAAEGPNTVASIRIPTPIVPTACVTCHPEDTLYGCEYDSPSVADPYYEMEKEKRMTYETKTDHPKHIWFNSSAPAKPAPTLAVTDIMNDFVRKVTTVLRYGSAIPLAPGGTVVFLLSHIYRRMSIRPSYLKGADVALYHALTSSGELKVYMNAVAYQRYNWYNPDEDARYAPMIEVTQPFAPPFTLENPPVFAEPVLVLDRGGEADMLENDEIQLGNDGCGEVWRYSAGAMFVSLAQED